MPLKIDVSESFPHLPRSPIVEAIIGWQARAGQLPDPDEFKAQLAIRLPEYTVVKMQHEVRFRALIAAAGISEAKQSKAWDGFRLEQSQEYVAQFTRDGVLFSRLAPYENWGRFISEGTRCWRVYQELALPPSLQRLAVRFINKIAIEPMEGVADYLQKPIAPPEVLDSRVESFFHKDVILIPKTCYRVNLTQTVQPAPPGSDARSLIVDIDVFANELPSIEPDQLVDQFKEMRWLKNKFFFSIFTEEAVRRFQEPAQ